MANKLSKVIANNETNPYIELVRNVEERSQTNSEAMAPGNTEPIKAEEPKAEEPKAEAKESKTTGKAGRPKKENKVKEIDHRLSVYINAEIYDYWKAETEAEHSNMATLINQLLKAEKERRESKDIN